MQKSITILPGVNKDGCEEDFEKITLELGQSISILGDTGSGKTALISDIELLSQRDSITKRQILVDNEIPNDSQRYDPMYKPIVMITQNTKCFSDLFIEEFLEIHAKARNVYTKSIIDETIDLANNFTGEKIYKNYRVTELSGGQTRSLLIADAIKIGAAPIILLDEIENAGIDKRKIEATVKTMNKLVCFVTHDPSIALQTDKRIIMHRGSVKEVIVGKSEKEKEIMQHILKADDFLLSIRKKMRMGRIEETVDMFVD